MVARAGVRAGVRVCVCAVLVCAGLCGLLGEPDTHHPGYPGGNQSSVCHKGIARGEPRTPPDGVAVARAARWSRRRPSGAAESPSPWSSPSLAVLFSWWFLFGRSRRRSGRRRRWRCCSRGGSRSCSRRPCQWPAAALCQLRHLRAVCSCPLVSAAASYVLRRSCLLVSARVCSSVLCCSCLLVSAVSVCCVARFCCVTTVCCVSLLCSSFLLCHHSLLCRSCPLVSAQVCCVARVCSCPLVSAFALYPLRRSFLLVSASARRWCLLLAAGCGGSGGLWQSLLLAGVVEAHAPQKCQLLQSNRWFAAAARALRC